jgi:hypothetical protein
MSEYLVNGVIVDTSKLSVVYSDGRYSNTGINYYTNNSKTRFFIEDWSRWQGSVDTLKEVDKQEFFDSLLNEQHDERVIDAFRELGQPLPEFAEY